MTVYIVDRYSAELREIVKQMLHPDPEKRPTTEELVEHPFLKPKVQKRQRSIYFLMIYSSLRSALSVASYHLQSLLSSLLSPLVWFLKPIINRYQPIAYTPPHATGSSRSQISSNESFKLTTPISPTKPCTPSYVSSICPHYLYLFDYHDMFTNSIFFI